MLDLDQTLLHTAETPEDKAKLLQGLLPSELPSQLLDLARHGATMQQRLADMLSVPRASLLEFFKRIRNRYQVFYLTAGVQSYGEAAVSAIQTFLLNDPTIDDADRRWIWRAVNPRYRALCLCSEHFVGCDMIAILHCVGHRQLLADKEVLDDL